jgi:predicted transcriptional regulator
VEASVSRTTLIEYLGGLRSKGFIATTGEGNSARQYITTAGRDALKNSA